MPNVQTIETYIQKSLNLIEAAPSEAKVSITYGSNVKKHQQKKKKLQQKQDDGSSSDIKTKSKKPLTKNFITFKTFEPRTGTCLKYKTYKVKEFSRLLSLLGPKSIQFNNSTVKSVGSLMSNSVSTDDNNNDQNNEDENVVAGTAESSGLDTKETTPQPSSGKKNKKKNKNKKR